MMNRIGVGAGPVHHAVCPSLRAADPADVHRGNWPAKPVAMRIAAIQCRSIADDPGSTGDIIVERLQWADDEKVDLVLFPEAFLLGHSYDPDTIRCRAEAASSGALHTLCDRIAAFRATLVIGAFERIDGQVFNSALVIERGRIVGRYAKAYPNEPGVTAGSDFPVFVRADARYGINICNDANHPDAADRIARQDAALILYPLNNMLRPATAERWRAKSIDNLIARARQTRCWVASADVAGTVGDRISFGCTTIVAPDGRVVARVPELQAGVAVHDIVSMPPSTPTIG